MMERGADGSLDPLFSREPMPHGQGQALPPKAGSGLQTARGRGLLQALHALPAPGLLVIACVLQSRVPWIYLHIAQTVSPGTAPQHTGVGAAGGEQKGGVQTPWARELEGDVPPDSKEGPGGCVLSNQGFSHLLRPCSATGLLLAVETGRGRLLHTTGPCCVAFPEDGPSKSLGSGVLCHRTPASCSASAAVLDSFPFSKRGFCQSRPSWSPPGTARPSDLRLRRDLARQLETVPQED